MKPFKWPIAAVLALALALASPAFADPVGYKQSATDPNQTFVTPATPLPVTQGTSAVSVDYSGRATPTASATHLSALITWSGATPTALSNGLLCSVISGTGTISFGDTSALTTSNGYPISTGGPTPHWSSAVNGLSEYATSSDGATVIACHGN